MTPLHMTTLYLLVTSSFHHQTALVLADKVYHRDGTECAITWLFCDTAAASSTERRMERRGRWLGRVNFENDGLSVNAPRCP